MFCTVRQQAQSNEVLNRLRYFTHSQADIKRWDADKNDAIETFIFQTI